MQNKNTRKPRLDKGRIQLTERDLWALRWIAEQYAVRLDEVQNLLGRRAGRGAKEDGEIGENAARLVVDRWKRAHLADYRKLTVQDPGWVWITAQGLREFALPYKPYAPSLSSLEHLFAVNEVRLLLEGEYPAGIWTSEREMRSGISYGKGKTFPHLPDALFLTPRGTVAIEAEISPKKPADLERIVRELAETYWRVWYFANSATHRGLVAACKRLDPSLAERVCICHRLFWGDGEDEEELEVLFAPLVEQEPTALVSEHPEHLEEDRREQ